MTKACQSDVQDDEGRGGGYGAASRENRSRNCLQDDTWYAHGQVIDSP